MEIALAPIQSYTHTFYRYSHAEVFNSFDKYYTPFFEEDRRSGWKPVLLPELSKELNRGIKVIPQIVTNTPEFLIRSAEKFAKMGYDEINLNMGCPFPMLVKRNKGAGLLREPELVEEILNSIFKQSDYIKLSVKIRLGVDQPDEWKRIVPVLNDFPVKEVIIHPRTARQKYGGAVNWDEFEKLTNKCNHPVTGNGDINSLSDYHNLQNHFPQVTSWMIGRGALSNPFLPGYIKGTEYTNQEKKELLNKFHQTYLQTVIQNFPVWNHAFNYMRSFWYYPLQEIENGQRLYKKIKKYLSREEYLEWSIKLLSSEHMLKQILNSLPPTS